METVPRQQKSNSFRTTGPRQKNGSVMPFGSMRRKIRSSLTQMWFQKRGKTKSAYGHSSLIGIWLRGLDQE